VTRGEDVRATLTAVSEGDAVAAIVYETDAAAAGGAVDTVEIPADVNALARYPVAALADSGNSATAAAFVEFVLSPEAQAILAGYGFAPPTS
jgi:molybdate transport system substrate-binding protein